MLKNDLFVEETTTIKSARYSKADRVAAADEIAAGLEELLEIIDEVQVEEEPEEDWEQYLKQANDILADEDAWLEWLEDVKIKHRENPEPTIRIMAEANIEVRRDEVLSVIKGYLSHPNGNRIIIEDPIGGTFVAEFNDFGYEVGAIKFRPGPEELRYAVETTLDVLDYPLIMLNITREDMLQVQPDVADIHDWKNILGHALNTDVYVYDTADAHLTIFSANGEVNNHHSMLVENFFSG